jgi:hypothetical protein
MVRAAKATQTVNNADAEVCCNRKGEIRSIAAKNQPERVHRTLWRSTDAVRGTVDKALFLEVYLVRLCSLGWVPNIYELN